MKIKILDEITKAILSKKRIEDIRKDVNKSRHMFSKSKINQIRKSFYDIKNSKNISKSKIKKIEKDLLDFEKDLSKPKKYHNYDEMLEVYLISHSIKIITSQQKPSVVLIIRIII